MDLGGVDIAAVSTNISIILLLLNIDLYNSENPARFSADC